MSEQHQIKSRAACGRVGVAARVRCLPEGLLNDDCCTLLLVLQAATPGGNSIARSGQGTTTTASFLPKRHTPACQAAACFEVEAAKQGSCPTLSPITCCTGQNLNETALCSVSEAKATVKRRWEQRSKVTFPATPFTSGASTGLSFLYVDPSFDDCCPTRCS